jgi:MraZ protein
MSSNSPVSDLFSGTVDYALDDKGRVTVPSNWRLKGVPTETFHLVPDSKGACLRIMRRERFAKFGEDAQTKLGLDEKAHRVFMRQFYANSAEVATDKQGRINIPKEYCERLGLRGTVTLVGAGDVIEVWNKQALAKRNAQEEPQYVFYASEMGL